VKSAVQTRRPPPRQGPAAELREACREADEACQALALALARREAALHSLAAFDPLHKHQLERLRVKMAFWHHGIGEAAEVPRVQYDGRRSFEASAALLLKAIETPRPTPDLTIADAHAALGLANPADVAAEAEQKRLARLAQLDARMDKLAEKHRRPGQSPAQARQALFRANDHLRAAYDAERQSIETRAAPVAA
jgi:hypothetical protein